MNDQEKKQWHDLAKTIAMFGGAIAILYGGGKWIHDTIALVATKEYHETHLQQVQEDVEQLLRPIQESVINSEQEAVVSRIRRILLFKCRNNMTNEFDDILAQQKRRYEKLVGRPFTVRSCEYYLTESQGASSGY